MDKKNREKRIKQIWFYKKLIKASREKELEVITSGFTKIECQFVRNEKSQRIDNEEVQRLFKSIFDSGESGINIAYPDEFIINLAMSLVWDKNILIKKPNDYIHLATAIELGCLEFITTDGTDFLNNAEVIRNKKGIRVITANQTEQLSEKYYTNDMNLNYSP